VRLPVSVSIGLAKIEPADTSTDELLARADLALYEAKHAGRDCARYRVRESR
jgi:PleD family two-component response regulator